MSRLSNDARAASRNVAFFGDGNMLHRPALEAVAGGFTVAPARFPMKAGQTPPPAFSVVICIAKIHSRDMDAIRQIVGAYPTPPVFIFPTLRADNAAYAAEFPGATQCCAPIDPATLREEIRWRVNRVVEESWRKLKPAEEKALRASLQSFDELFGASSRGAPLPVEKVYAACETIQGSLGESNVDRWLGSLRNHHNSTYRHSMFVCGTLAFFAHALGVRGDELRRMTVGGFLHDAGKARVPLEILNKPGKLDDQEWAVMRRHPEHSRELLLLEQGLDPDIIAMAVHHHEKIDGTGYPDNLRGAELNDYVRLTAIADVYAALAEERAYKPAMPTEKALEIMSGFKGHLDMALVRRFREFILDSSAREAA